MEKLICTKTGNEVKMGDKFQIDGKVNTPFGDLNTTQVVPVNEETLDKLIEMKIVKRVETEKVNTTKVSMEIEYYIQNLANEMHWQINKTINYLRNISSIYPSATFSILLKQIAIELDKQYPDHINSCEEVFSVSMINGKITKIPRAHIKNFRNFAAFRTLEDARIACRILKPFLKAMFKSEKGK